MHSWGSWWKQTNDERENREREKVVIYTLKYMDVWAVYMCSIVSTPYIIIITLLSCYDM